MVKAESKPVSEKELEEESDIEEIIEKDEKSFRDKDGTGYGDLMTTNVMPYNVNTDSETYVGKPAPSNNQTYIEESKSNNMVDANKLTHTRVGDYINFYQNGVQDSGVVAKMGSAFITIFKEDGSFHNVHINDTFFVSDILVNKTWNDMNMEERTEELMKVKAYSPRYLSKTWEQLPIELRDVMKLRSDDWDEREKEIELDEEGRPKTFEDKQRALHRQGIGRSGTALSGQKLKKPLTAGEDEEMYGQIYERQNETLKSEFQRQSTSARIGNFDHMRGTTNQDKIKLREAASTETATEPPMNRSDPYKIDPTKPAPTKKRGGRKSDYRTIKRSDQEQGAYGNIGGRPNVGISTDTKIDADDDYEGNSHDDIQIENQFQHDVKAPKTDKDPVKKARDTFDHRVLDENYGDPRMSQRNYDDEMNAKGKRKIPLARSEQPNKNPMMLTGSPSKLGESLQSRDYKKIPKEERDEYKEDPSKRYRDNMNRATLSPSTVNMNKAGEFVYTDKPTIYKVPDMTKLQKGYGIKYGVKYISEEENEN